MHVQSKTEVVARIIHSFILDLEDVAMEFLSFSTLLSPNVLNPINPSLCLTPKSFSVLHISTPNAFF